MMKTPLPAAGEAMPEINRRRLLLGLAAASTAAATSVPLAVAAPQENPELLRLAADLEAIVARYRSARDAYRRMENHWYSVAPLAPDALTILGDDPHTVVQEGAPETWPLGGYRYRKGERFPRRIVLRAAGVRAKINTARTDLRRAKKRGSLADVALLEDQITRLSVLWKIADDYQQQWTAIEKQAHAESDVLLPPMSAAHEALEVHISAIMAAPDWTMEGLIIKAQALAEWDSVCVGSAKLAFVHGGSNWHGQIAASILRHAKGAAA